MPRFQQRTLKQYCSRRFQPVPTCLEDNQKDVRSTEVVYRLQTAVTEKRLLASEAAAIMTVDWLVAAACARGIAELETDQHHQEPIHGLASHTFRPARFWVAAVPLVMSGGWALVAWVVCGLHCGRVPDVHWLSAKIT